VIQILLPIPPTTNSIYKFTSRGGFARSYISDEGRVFFEAAGYAIKKQYRKKTPIEVECEVWIDIYISHKRDVDGSIKPILDALQKFGVIKNDDLFYGLHVVKHKVKKGEEKVEVQIMGY